MNIRFAINLIWYMNLWMVSTLKWNTASSYVFISVSKFVSMPQTLHKIESWMATTQREEKKKYGSLRKSFNAIRFIWSKMEFFGEKNTGSFHFDQNGLFWGFRFDFVFECVFFFCFCKRKSHFINSNSQLKLIATIAWCLKNLWCNSQQILGAAMNDATIIFFINHKNWSLSKRWSENETKKEREGAKGRKRKQRLLKTERERMREGKRKRGKENEKERKA